MNTNELRDRCIDILNLHNFFDIESMYVTNGTKQGCVMALVLVALFFSVMLKYATFVHNRDLRHVNNICQPFDLLTRVFIRVVANS